LLSKERDEKEKENVKEKVREKEKPKELAKEDKVSKRLIHNFEASDKILGTMSFDEDDATKPFELSTDDIRKSTDIGSKIEFPKNFFRRESRAENSFTNKTSSFIETDASILSINKKIEEMKKPKQKKDSKKEFTFRK